MTIPNERSNIDNETHVLNIFQRAFTDEAERFGLDLMLTRDIALCTAAGVITVAQAVRLRDHERIAELEASNERLKAFAREFARAHTTREFGLPAWDMDRMDLWEAWRHVEGEVQP